MGNWTKSLTISFNRLEGQGEAEVEKEYEADVEVTIEHDSNYGADADGHRGVPMDFIDEVKVKEVRVMDGSKVIETIKEEDVSDELFEVISDKAGEADLSPEEPDQDDQGEDE